MHTPQRSLRNTCPFLISQSFTFTRNFLPNLRMTNFVSGLAKFMTSPLRPARPQRPALHKQAIRTLKRKKEIITYAHSAEHQLVIQS